MALKLAELSQQLDLVASMALDTLSASEDEEAGPLEDGLFEEEITSPQAHSQMSQIHYSAYEDSRDTPEAPEGTFQARDVLRSIARRLAHARGEGTPLLPLHEPDYSDYNPFVPSRRFQLVPFLFEFLTRCILVSQCLHEHMGTARSLAVAVVVVVVVVVVVCVVLYFTGLFYIVCAVAKAILCYVANTLLDGTGSQVC